MEIRNRFKKFKQHLQIHITSIDITIQVQEIIWYLILNLTVCISAFLQRENAANLLIKPEFDENK